MISRATIKADAKLAISNSKPNAILITLVYLIIAYILQYLTFQVMGYAKDAATFYDAFTTATWNFDSIPMTNRPFAPILSLAISIMSMMIAAGYTIYCLNISRMRTASFGNLFDGFGIFFRILWLNILMGIFTFLWSLLFIIPGIVAYYRYRQALYILLDNPDMSALDCITASKRLMRGRKAELFVLDLSFIGWWILSLIPFVPLWVTPYTNLTFVNYYNTLIRMDNAGYSSRDNQPPSDGEGQDREDRNKTPWEF